MTVSQLQTIFTAQIATNKTISQDGLREWEKIKQIYQGESLSAMLMEYALKFIGNNPRMVALVKILFIETLGKIQGDINEWSGLPPGVKDLFQVLIQERNNLIVTNLKEEISKSKKSSKIALFYGAAHMSDLEKRLEKELKYRPLDQIWYKAFSVDIKKNKITEFERTIIGNTVDMIIREMKGKY
jgi:pheromone shutdown protein TraB